MFKNKQRLTYKGLPTQANCQIIKTVENIKNKPKHISWVNSTESTGQQV